MTLTFNQKVANFNIIHASAVSSHLTKTASKWMHPFGWNLFTDRQTHTHTHMGTNCNENITPPRICEGVKSNCDPPMLVHNVGIFDIPGGDGSQFFFLAYACKVTTTLGNLNINLIYKVAGSPKILKKMLFPGT